MIAKSNIRRIYFLISYLIIVNIAHADAIREIMKSNGWSKSKDYEINSSSGIFSAESYTKKIGEVDAQLIYLPSKKKLYGNKAQSPQYESPLFFFDNEIHTIHWMMGYSLTIGGINFLVNDEKETSTALQNFQTVFSRNTKELTKIRRYKGAFGPIDVGGRGLQSVKFLGTNLLLTFLDGGKETTLELGPGFDYVSSTVANGRKINPSGVVSSPMKSLADVHRKIEEDGAKMMAAEREKEAAKTADNPPPEKKPESAPESPIPDQAKFTEDPQLPVTQDPTPSMPESAMKAEGDAIKETVENNNSWIIAALALILSSIAWILIKQKQRSKLT